MYFSKKNHTVYTSLQCPAHTYHAVALFPGQILPCHVISGPDKYTTTHSPSSLMADMYFVLIYFITYFVSNFILIAGA